MTTRPLGGKSHRLTQIASLLLPGLLGTAAALFPQTVHAQDQTLPFTDILFIERGIVGGSEYNGSHFCDEYFGHNGKRGGGLFILKNFQSANRQKVDLVAGLKVPAGKVNAGQTLSSGTFLSPDLSFDGKTVVFAWSSGGGDASGGSEKWVAKDRFHLFKVDIDGTNLVQLTDGDFDDLQPAWMPNGRIVFISTRRGGYGRCHGRAVPTYTLHSMKADGTDIIRLSEHETNEFHPAIANDGRIVYMRWDYIDRDALAAHHIWFTNPDGTNPRSWGGNYSNPLDTMVGAGPWTDGRKDGKRPQSEFYPRPIPGSATKFVAVAGPHHGEAYGTLIIRDFAKVDDNQMGQVTKITPEVGMPETAENGSLTYGPAWPLSETQFLSSYNNSLVLVDTSVKPTRRTEYYKTSNTALRPIYAMPVAPRTKPPVIAETTYQGERWYPTAPPATVQVQNVYTTDAYGKLPAGAKVKSMRIVQILSKSTPLANVPRLGYSSQNVAKLSLGTVPVEEDGSVFFEAPIGKLLLFQILDDKGMAIQTMRSATYLHPGENMTCTGCHEDKMSAPPAGGTPLASKRPASKMEPEAGRVEPINYARYISPILTKKCFPCHQGKAGAPTNAAYSAMAPYAFWFAGDANGNLEAVHGGSRSKAGMIGARGSRMGKALLNATHQKALSDGTFNETDMRTLVQWLDLGSDELGHCDNEAAQKRGELVWPSLDLDKNDPQGLKYKPETPYVERKDAGVPGPDAATGGTTTKYDASTTATGGSTSIGSTGGVNASGGQIGSGGAGGSGGAQASGGAGANGGSQASTGGNRPGGTSSGGALASSGGNAASGGSSATGGHAATGGKTSDTGTNTTTTSKIGGCAFGTTTSPWSRVGSLFLLGLALLLRKRRR